MKLIYISALHKNRVADILHEKGKRKLQILFLYASVCNILCSGEQLKKL